MKTRMEFRASQEIWRGPRQIQLLILLDHGDSHSIASPLTFVAPPADYAPVDPSISMPVEAAQQLMDELWRVGLRPSEGTGSAGAMSAVEKHLTDMQRLVFDVLCPTVVPKRDA